MSRLLDVALDSGDTDQVRRTLVAEARSFFDVRSALLLAADADDRTLIAVAGDPVEPRDGLPTPGDLERLDSRVGGRREPIHLDGELGVAMARAVALENGASSIALPMGTRDWIDCVLILADDADRVWTDAELDVASAFARVAAACLAQRRLVEERLAQSERQAAVARAAHELNESLDLDAVLTGICREAASILDADNAALYLGNAIDGVVVEAVHNHPLDALGYRLPAGTGLSGKVVQSDRPMLTNDYTRISGLPGGALFGSVRSALAVPMHWDGQLRGALSVGYVSDHPVSADDLRLLETFAELAAVACRNASAHAGLAAAARTDALTGCLNHAALHDSLRREVERSMRTNRELALVMVDLDDFKQVNERHGHLAGDELLRRVGHALRQGVRPYDLVARYGGDEFAIVAPDAGEDAGVEIAERAIERLASATRGLPTPLGRGPATAGVAAWSSGMSATELITRADAALLRGKRLDLNGTAMRASEMPGADSDRTKRRAQSAPAAPRTSRWPVGSGDPHADRLRRRTRQLALAQALGSRLAAMTDPGAITDAGVDELHRALGYLGCAVLSRRDDTSTVVSAARGPLADAGEPRPLDIVERCVRERRSIVIDDVRVAGGVPAQGPRARVRSQLAVPISVGERLWGALIVEDVRAAAFDEDDVRMAHTIADQIGLALRSALLYQELDRAYLGTAEALATALEAKDSYTWEHARSIVENADAVGRRMGMGESDLRDLRYGAVLHDIGKIAVPEPILNKRGPLADEEADVIRRHTLVGEQILRPIEFLSRVRLLVRHEHERWDGEGYPDGLEGEDIPLGSRVILACDAYDAMTSDRPYREAMSAREAQAELRRFAGTQFDPTVVETLLRLLEERAGDGRTDAEPDPREPREPREPRTRMLERD